MKYLIAGMMICFVLPLAAKEKNRQYELLGISKDNRYFVVKVQDKEMGDMLEAYQVFDTKKKGMEFFNKNNEKKVVKGFKRKFGIKAGWSEGPKTPDEKYAVLGMQDGDFLRIFFLKDDMFGYYTKIELEKEEETGPPAKAFLKQSGYTSDGKYIILVFHQKLEGKNKFIDSDYLLSFKFEPHKIKYVTPKDEKKK